MISEFTKKLLFTNQLEIFNGHVTVLENQYTIMPVEALLFFEKANPETAYKVVKKAAFENADALLKKTGFKGEQALHLLVESFDLYGIGQLQIVDKIEQEHKVKIRLMDSNYLKECRRLNQKPTHSITCGTLAGIFSRYFLQDVEATLSEEMGNDCEIIVKQKA